MINTKEDFNTNENLQIINLLSEISLKNADLYKLINELKIKLLVK